MARRYYSSTAARTTLASGVNDSTTTFTVAAVSGWPSSFPYTLIIDQDTINEEIVEVTARSGTTLTVTRGVDGTTGVAHDAGASVNHGVSARDFDEPNAFINGTDFVSTDGGSTVTASGAAVTPLTLKGASGQTANLLTVENSAGSDLVVVDESGNVGIGTSSPSSSLDVSSTVNPNLYLRNTGDTSAERAVTVNLSHSNDVGARIRMARASGASDGAYLALDTEPTGGTVTERMRIDSSGNVGIGTSSPSVKLSFGTGTVGSAGDPNVVRLYDTGSSGTSYGLGISSGNLNIVSPVRISFYLGGSERVKVDSDGLITGSGTSLGAWTAYTPTLTASTTNPTLGTGSTASGAYCQIGKVVHFRARIEFGTSGMAAGTGDYYVSLPVTAWSGYPASFPIGYVVIQDQSTGTRYNGLAVINSATTVRLDMSSTNANSIAAADASPMAWAASDDIWINGTYEIA